MNILVNMHLHPDQITQLEALPDVHLIDRDEFTPAMGSTIDVILAWNPTAAAIMSAPNHVRFIQTISAGVDYLPLADLARQEVLVANASGIHGESIAESVLGYILNFTRALNAPTNRDPHNFWAASQLRHQITELPGRRALIVGAGHIGTTISHVLQQLGVRTTGVNRDGHAVAGFDQIISTATLMAQAPAADFIINILPLTDQTHHLYNDDFFQRQPGHPYFINVGRGPSVDTAALIRALEVGKVAGAALDVFEEEPLPASSPLWQAPNVQLTPHVSGTVSDVDTGVFKIFYPNLVSLMDHGTLAVNAVDLARGY